MSRGRPPTNLRELQDRLFITERLAVELARQLGRVTSDLHTCVHGVRWWENCNINHCEATRKLIRRAAMEMDDDDMSNIV